MLSRHALIGGVLIPATIAVVSAPLFVWAAGNPVVVESRESTVTYQPPIEDETDFNPAAGVEDQYQLQLLQQEIMTLRGLVEELQYQLNRQKAVQDDRYLELDARLQKLMKSTTERAPVSQPVPGDPSGSSIDGIVTTPPTDADITEREFYETTQTLIRNRQYDMAISQLDALIARYPDGDYTANAYYWLGQVHAAKSDPDYEKSRQALAQVITYFPDHNKVPDAAYALGKVYHTLGDCERARELLQSVVDRFPGKSAATLAQTYLQESVSCSE